MAGLGGQVRELPILDPDDVGLGQGEVDVELDEVLQRLLVGGPRCESLFEAEQQAFAHPDQQLDEHRLFAREVVVERGTADSDLCSEVFDRDGAIAPFGEQVPGGGEISLPPLCLLGRPPGLCHGTTLRENGHFN